MTTTAHASRSPSPRLKPAGIVTKSARSGMTVFARKSPPLPSAVYDTYWAFAAKRQDIFHARILNKRGPWTDDSILQEHKFTNAYRAADRTSQFLISRVIYARPADWPSTLLRVLLFKVFNKSQTWELLEAELGPIDALTFSPTRINSVLDEALSKGKRIYSNAYIMPSGPASIRQPRKHHMHTALLESILKSSIVSDLATSPSMAAAFEVLRSVPSFGPFLALQFLIDLNYSPHLNFSEMDFVVPGPGARDGIRKCFVHFGGYDETGIIEWVTDRQEQEFQSRGLQFRSLWGRSLHLIDCQNLFCEVDKYARVAHPEVAGISGRTRIKQKFLPDRSALRPWFPPKWRLNAFLPD